MDHTIWRDDEGKEAEDWLREQLFHKYWNVSALGQSWLAETGLIEGCLLAGDEHSIQARGIAVQVTLDWALEMLRKRGGEYYRQSGDVLQKRYIEGLSNKKYADLRFIDDQTAHSRRKMAIRRVLDILRQELKAPSGASERKQRMIERRYANCSDEEQLLLRLVAISGERIAIDLVTELENIALENYILPLLSKNLLLSDDDARQIHLHPELSEHLAVFKRADLPLDIWAQLKLMAGRAAELSKDLTLAFEAYREALAAEDHVIKAEAYYLLACLYEQGDIDAAFEHYEAAKRHLSTANSAKSRELLANTAIREAWLFIIHRSDFEKAAENLQQAQEIVDRYEQEHRLHSDLHTTWASFYVYSPQANPQLAYQHRWRAWQEASEAQDIELLINTTYNLGIACSRTDKYEQALRHLQQSQKLAKEAGNERMEVLSKKGIGDCYLLEGSNYEKAIEYYLEAYHDFERKGYHYWLGEVCEDLVKAYIGLGKALKAKKYFDQGLDIAEKLGNEKLKANFETLAETYIELVLDLHDRERQAITYIRQNGSITNKELRHLTGVKSNKTAAIDLNQLVEKGICIKVGKGRGTKYEMVG